MSSNMFVHMQTKIRRHKSQNYPYKYVPYSRDLPHKQLTKPKPPWPRPRPRWCRVYARETSASIQDLSVTPTARRWPILPSYHGGIAQREYCNTILRKCRKIQLAPNNSIISSPKYHMKPARNITFIPKGSRARGYSTTKITELIALCGDN